MREAINEMKTIKRSIISKLSLPFKSFLSSLTPSSLLERHQTFLPHEYIFQPMDIERRMHGCGAASIIKVRHETIIISLLLCKMNKTAVKVSTWFGFYKERMGVQEDKRRLGFYGKMMCIVRVSSVMF
jgi:hypothetical protein